MNNGTIMLVEYYRDKDRLDHKSRLLEIAQRRIHAITREINHDLLVGSQGVARYGDDTSTRGGTSQPDTAVFNLAMAYNHRLVRARTSLHRWQRRERELLDEIAEIEMRTIIIDREMAALPPADRDAVEEKFRYDRPLRMIAAMISQRYDVEVCHTTINTMIHRVVDHIGKITSHQVFYKSCTETPLTHAQRVV